MCCKHLFRSCACHSKMGNQNEEIEALQCSQLFTLKSNNKELVMAIAILAAMFVLLTNSMLIYGVMATKERSKSLKTTEKMFLFMSCTDVLTIVVFVHKIAFDEYQIKISCLLDIATICVLDGTFFMNSMLLSILTVLRYISIKKPFFVVPKRIINTMCTFSTVLTLLYTGGLYCTYIYVLPEEDFHKMLIIISFALLLLVDFVLIVNTMSYLQLVGKPSESPSIDNNISSTSISLERKKKAAKSLLMISFCYSICNTPLPVYTMIELFQGRILENVANWMQLFYLLMILNTGINALVYILKNGKIRKLYTCSLSCKPSVTN